ncbi:MAG: hypothetical protein MJY91_09760 [Bacteroidales bacterium]|nr:hypothetical protein [Bacteroidales bacterium]
MDTANEIQFRIVKCEELSFETKLSASMKVDLNTVSFRFGFRIVPSGEDKVSFIISALYFLGKDQILKQESSSTFEISNFDSALDFSVNGKVDDKVGIVPTLFSISYSTMRGMLAIRTAGTVLESFPAPIVNPTEITHKSIINK